MPKSGAVPFAKLSAGRVIEARWSRNRLPPVKEGGWRFGDEVDAWSFHLDGEEFRVFDLKKNKWWEVSDTHDFLDEAWKNGDEEPLDAKPLSDGRFETRFRVYYSNHFGSVTTKHRLVFDPAKMTAEHLEEESVVDID